MWTCITLQRWLLKETLILCASEQEEQEKYVSDDSHYCRGNIQDHGKESLRDRSPKIELIQKSAILPYLQLDFGISDGSSSSQCAEKAAAPSHQYWEAAQQEGEDVWPSTANMQWNTFEASRWR